MTEQPMGWGLIYAFTPPYKLWRDLLYEYFEQFRGPGPARPQDGVRFSKSVNYQPITYTENVMVPGDFRHNQQAICASKRDITDLSKASDHAHSDCCSACHGQRLFAP
jgi:hypothetical protein